LNFFRGFEYDPTADWEAMVTDAGMVNTQGEKGMTAKEKSTGWKTIT
jgi:hypothetical protein